MLVDLDGFKLVNDGFGHAIGDACIKEAARQLGEICARANLVARIGGDEFAILLGHEVDEAAVETLSERIVSILSRPMSCAGYLIQIGASVGSARVSGPCSSVDLFNRADVALYAAKAAGRGTARRFAPDMGREGDRLPPWPVAREGDHGSSLEPTTH
jgi:diguanylate cyclase (GGDEF)-like protein